MNVPVPARNCTNLFGTPLHMADEIDLSFGTYEYFDNLAEAQEDKTQDQSTLLQEIFAKLDKIMISQEKIQTRLDTLE